MKRFKAINIVTFSSGKLQLSEAQAKPRLQNLKHIKADIYEIVNAVQFKTGEVVGYDGEINKILAIDIEVADAEKKGKLTEKEIIEKINACETIAEVQVLTKNETRKKVIDVAKVKIKELEKQLEHEAAGGIKVEEIIANINKQELESEIDVICNEIDRNLLTEDEARAIEDAAEKRIQEIRELKSKK